MATPTTRMRSRGAAPIIALALVAVLAGETPAGAASSAAAVQEDVRATHSSAAFVAESDGVLTEAAPRPPTGTYIPALSEVSRDTTALHRAGCQQSLTGSRLIVCVRGDTTGRRRVWLVGASHATHWYPAVNRVARERGWRLLTAVKAGCKLNLSREFARTTRDRSCKLWLEALVARIRRNPPAMIITTGTVTTPSGERLPAGYIDMWRLFNRLGVKVVAIRDTPRASFDRVACLRNHPSAPGRCAVARNPTLDAVNPLVRRQDELPGNVNPVDLTESLCTTTMCPAVSGSYVIYRDRHHLTETFARRLATRLGAQVP